jgi:hypothetical protein
MNIILNRNNLELGYQVELKMAVLEGGLRENGPRLYKEASLASFHSFQVPAPGSTTSLVYSSLIWNANCTCGAYESFINILSFAYTFYFFL